MTTQERGKELADLGRQKVAEFNHLFGNLSSQANALVNELRNRWGWDETTIAVVEDPKAADRCPKGGHGPFRYDGDGTWYFCVRVRISVALLIEVTAEAGDDAVFGFSFPDGLQPLRIPADFDQVAKRVGLLIEGALKHAAALPDGYEITVARNPSV